MHQTENNKFSAKDYIWMSTFVVLGLILLLVRIGSHTAPETVYEMTKSSETGTGLIFSFPKDTEISRISIFQGDSDHQEFGIYNLSEDMQQWDTMAERLSLDHTFYWNNIKVTQKVNTIGMVLFTEHAMLHEIVFLDGRGNRVKPLNADEYPELFDEQECYEPYETYYEEMMFDEVYHARTGYEMVHQRSIYELSHPPLGKILIGVGIRLFGMNPFGWRFMAALFGSMLIAVIYAFTKKITGKTKYAIAAAILLNLDFMHFALSRIGTIDAFVAFFAVTAFYLMYCFMETEAEYASLRSLSKEEKKRYQRKEILQLFLCGLMLGSAIATKWTGVYAGVGLLILMLCFLFRQYRTKADWKHSASHLRYLSMVCICCFLLLPAGIYVLSYLPYIKVFDYGLLEMAVLNSKDMLHFHENVTEGHIYASSWYEWPLNTKPIVDWITDFNNQTVCIVATFGNPVLWYSGLGALVHNMYLWLKKKDWASKYLCIGYLSMMVPWIFVQRTVFIYQYYIPAIFLIPLLMHSFSHQKDEKNRKLIILLVAAGLLFVLFYAILSGVPIQKEIVERWLSWLPSWKFMNLLKH